jgi:REP element-mobilizing transposase RayT
LSDGGFQLVDIGLAKNHVHLLVIATGTEFNLAEFANRLKTESSIFFKNLFPLSWPFWQVGFFVASVGKNSVKRVSKYLSKQS